MSENTPDTDALRAELAAIRKELQRANGGLYMKAHNRFLTMIGYNFARGLAVGLGTVMGATILVSIAAFFLSQIDFIPVIGDWAATIAGEISRQRMEPTQ